MVRTDSDADASAAPQTMQCMEVWGGNEIVDSSVVMSGLDAWVYCKPYQDAAGGGDVYYVSSCATGRITRLLVADVSGHGAAVCSTASDLRSLMRQFVNHIDQKRFVHSMNRQFTALAQNGCFATALVTTFFSPTKELSLCNAGHPPPLLYRAAEREWSYLRERTTQRDAPSSPGATNFPLGIVDLNEYAQFSVRLNLGDVVLCFTDSLIEARDDRGQLLGEDGLLEVVRTVDVGDPPHFIPSLLGAIEAKAAGNLTGDDVTILLFRPNGLSGGVRLKDRLLAPFRVLSAAAGAWRRHESAPWPEFSFANLGGAMIGPLSRFGRRRRD